MNEKKARELRRAVYGSLSRRGTTYKRDLKGSICCEGRRATYQKLKRNSRPQSEPNKPTHKGKRRPRWLFPGKRDS